MSNVERDGEEGPPESSGDDREQGEELSVNWVRIAVVTAGLLLLALGLLQVTGVTDLLYPIAETESGQWFVFAIMVVGVLIIAVTAWTWRTPSE